MQSHYYRHEESPLLACTVTISGIHRHYKTGMQRHYSRHQKSLLHRHAASLFIRDRGMWKSSEVRGGAKIRNKLRYGPDPAFMPLLISGPSRFRSGRPVCSGTIARQLPRPGSRYRHGESLWHGGRDTFVEIRSGHANGTAATGARADDRYATSLFARNRCPEIERCPGDTRSYVSR